MILDGIVPADWTFAEFDESLDGAGRRLLERCVRSSECAGHLGPDPIALAEALPGKFDSGHCPDLSNEIDGAMLRLVFGNMMMGGPDVWPYIPAMIYRMDRCKIRDLEAAGALFETLFESEDAGEPESHSPVLQRHVAMSELWPESGGSPAGFEAALTRTTMTTGVSASFAKTYADWPRYPQRRTGRRHGRLQRPDAAAARWARSDDAGRATRSADRPLQTVRARSSSSSRTPDTSR